MRKLQIKFPGQIRISGWDFGSSARAMNQAGVKDSLTIDDVSVFVTQAASEKVSKTTTERKQMSTKTILKRIALIAAGSLVVGVVATVPAQAKPGAGANCDATWVLDAPAQTGASAGTAYTNTEQTALGDDCSAQLDDTAIGTNAKPMKSVTTSQVAGPTNYVRLKAFTDINTTNKSTATYSLEVTGGAISATTGVWGDTSTSDWILSAGNTVATLSADASTKNDWKIGDPTSGDYITIPTTAVGQIVVKWKKAVYSGGVLQTVTTLQTFTVNVTTSQSVLSYVVVNGTGANNIAGAPNLAGAPTSYADSDGNIYATKGSGAAPATVATVYVHQVAPGGTDLSSLYTKAVTASLSGVGGLNGTVAGASVNFVAIPANGGNADAIVIKNDGRAGVATLTIAVNGVVAKTIKVTFYGSAVAIKTDQQSSYIGAAGVGMADAVWVWAVDANGIAVPGTSFTATSSDSAVITGSTVGTMDDGTNYAWGAYPFAVATSSVSTSGQKASVTYSFVNADGATVSAAATPFTLGGVVKTVALAFDAANYDLGAPAVLTASTLDASGNVPYDGQAVPGTSTTNMASAGLVQGSSAFGVIADGKAKLKLFAPAIVGSGTWTVDRLVGTTHVLASATLTADTSAVDAANEATDAANAATDAANAAAEAADAATAAAQDAQAAVAALATQVASLIAGIKAQITTLANLVLKIKKKVKA